MHRELQPPRESIVDLALLLEVSLERSDEDWWSGDQVMDLHLLKGRLKDQEGRLNDVLDQVRLQGTALVLSAKQKKELREEALGLVGVCMNILQACQLLDPEMDLS